jgi:hypothetical protein
MVQTIGNLRGMSSTGIGIREFHLGHFPKTSSIFLPPKQHVMIDIVYIYYIYFIMYYNILCVLILYIYIILYIM